MNLKLSSLVAAAALSIGAISAHANIIAPGTQAAPDNFGTFTTDVGYDDLAAGNGIFAAGGVNPCSVGRSSAGTVVSFNYPSSSGGTCNITPGVTTSVLLIETNATVFNAGTFSAIDGSTATVVAYGPLASTVTPEPSSLDLLGTRILRLAGAARRKLRK